MTGERRSAPLAALRWRPFHLPLGRRFEAAHAAIADRSGVLVELLDVDGARGVGEASPMPSLGDGGASDVERLLREHATAILADPDRTMDVLPDAPGAAALRCALDTALLDLEGRRRALPVAELFNERPARSVEVNAVLGGGTAEEAEQFAVEAHASGYRVLKLKVASGDLDADVERIERVRRACPDADIRLDANGAWSEAVAAEALRRLAPFRIELIEQPVRANAVDALARLHATGTLPIAADEVVPDGDQLERVFALRAADLVVLKPMRLGGISASLEVARRAAARGMRSFVTTTFDSTIGTVAALHVALALGEGRPADGLSTGEHLADDLVTTPLLPRKGRLWQPSTPGLGVELDEAAVERLATGPWVEVRSERR